MYLFWRHSHPPPAFKVEQLHCDLGLFQREVRQAFSSAERNCGGKTFFKGWCLGEIGNSQQYFCILGIKKKKLTLNVVQIELDSILLALCQVCILLLFLSERFWFLFQHLSLPSSTLEPGGKVQCLLHREKIWSHQSRLVRGPSLKSRVRKDRPEYASQKQKHILQVKRGVVLTHGGEVYFKVTLGRIEAGQT